MMVSHDSLAKLTGMFAPPGLTGQWVSDQLNASTAACYDVVVCTTGWAAAEFRRLHVRNLHATVLHQMGLDPNRLAYFYGGLDQRLVGVEGAEPIRQII